jgi:hypothetical protein
MPKLEVFLSHRTTEMRFADLIKARLDEDFFGIINLYYSNDITSVPVGTKWDQNLLAALCRAKVMLALCSPHSITLHWINFEIGGAAARQIPIMPLCHSGLTPEQLPASIRTNEAVILPDAKSLKKWYDELSKLIDCRVPKIDFDSLAGQFTKLEEIYASEIEDQDAAIARQTEDRSVEYPHVVCVTSQQYRELGMANEIETVLASFPKMLQHDIVLSSADLMKALSSPVEIVHIAGYVCPRSGTLFFSRMRLPEGESEGREEYVKADVLKGMLRKAGTQLVVIASGDSLALVSRLLPVVHVISPQDRISAAQMALWVKEFYQLLWAKTLTEACEMATMQSGATMKMMPRHAAGGPAAGAADANADGACAIEPT